LLIVLEADPNLFEELLNQFLSLALIETKFLKKLIGHL
jgi:hypothetical protein